MDKEKMSTIAAPIVVSLVCVVLAVNLVEARSQLNSERAQTTELNRQIISFAPKLSGLQVKYDEQLRKVRELQNSLDGVRREAQDLRNVKADLEARLTSALAALQTPAEAEAVE